MRAVSSVDMCTGPVQTARLVTREQGGSAYSCLREDHPDPALGPPTIHRRTGVPVPLTESAGGVGMLKFTTATNANPNRPLIKTQVFNSSNLILLIVAKNKMIC